MEEKETVKDDSIHEWRMRKIRELRKRIKEVHEQATKNVKDFHRSIMRVPADGSDH